MTMKNGHPASRPTYTPAQLDQYFARIRLPSKYLAHPIVTTKSVSASTPDETLSFLTTLIRRQLSAIPFENLALHYSAHYTITLSTPSLFRKIVSPSPSPSDNPVLSTRGGYCMELSALFATVLRSLGYNLITTGARVNTAVQPTSQTSLYARVGPTYDGWNHMVCLVTVGSTRYLVDVGMGNTSPTFPVPLMSYGEGVTAVNVQPAMQVRLRREVIPEVAETGGDPSWVYSVRYSSAVGHPWLPGYCFNEVEFLPQDYEMMNYFVSRARKSWFTTMVVCSRFIVVDGKREKKDGEDVDEVVIGDVTLFEREVKERKYGVSRNLVEGAEGKIMSETERVDILERSFGIQLTEEEREGISNLNSVI